MQFRNRLFGLSVLLVLGMVPVVSNLAIISQATATTPAAVTQVTSAQLQTMLAKKDFTLINVHTPYEGEIEKTDAFIAYDTIAANLDKLPKDKNAAILVYCLGGGMSAVAAKELVAQGYTRIFDLQGGMNAWVSGGNKIYMK